MSQGESMRALYVLSDSLVEYQLLHYFSFDSHRIASVDGTVAESAIAAAIISLVIYLCNREMADPCPEEG
jgi:hypothetical protein